MTSSLDQWRTMQWLVNQLADSAEVDERSDVDVCRIYDATALTDADHNCVGCNLKDLILETKVVVDAVVERHERDQAFRADTAFRVVAGLLNSYWEQLMDALRVVRLDESYLSDGTFESFRQLRRWTNFFKHPGPFGYLVHHPLFVQDGSTEHSDAIQEKPTRTILEYEYVAKFHAAGSDKRRNAQVELLKDSEDVLVVLPNLDALAEGLLRETRTAVDLLSGEPFASVLRKRSTVEQFFASEWAEADSSEGT